MQIRKFEAQTIQEAIETIKRELGPEAIILQTKRNRGAFGLMSKGSVEVTAAVSEKALQKKGFFDKRLSTEQRKAFDHLPADKQREKYDQNLERQNARTATKPVAGNGQRHKGQNQDQSLGGKSQQEQQRRITATRYIDIDDGGDRSGARAAGAPSFAASKAATAAYGAGSTKASASNGAVARVKSNVSQKEQDAIAEQILKAQAARSVGYVGTQAQGIATIKATPYGDEFDAPVDQVAHNLVSARGEAGLQDEVRQLKHMLAELKANQDSGDAHRDSTGPGSLSTPALRDALEMLVLNGVERRHAYSVVKKVAFEIGEENSQNPDAVLDQIAAEIMDHTEVLSLFDGIDPASRKTSDPIVMALVGPTGVGKTTTLAKIASEAVLKRNLKVGLLNVDTYKVAAIDQLSAYAEILNVPFRSVGDAQELQLALKDFQHLDLVLVDTSGRSQKDTDSLREMEKMLHSIPSLRMQLVLSVTTRDQELVDMGKRFSMLFRPEGLILSKLDEAMTFGTVINVSSKLKLPLIYFTTGQRVPEDIEGATKERVAALVMEL